MLAKGCYENGQCKVYAEDLVKELEKNGIKGGEIRELKGVGPRPIVKAGQATGEAVAAGGQSHYRVQIGNNIYEMYSIKGIPVSQWANMYETAVGAKAMPTVLVPLPM